MLGVVVAVPLLGVGGVNLFAVGGEEVAEGEEHKDAFGGGVDDATAVLETDISDAVEDTGSVLVEERAFDVPLGVIRVIDVVEGEADAGVMLRSRGLQGDIP